MHASPAGGSNYAWVSGLGGPRSAHVWKTASWPSGDCKREYAPQSPTRFSATLALRVHNPMNHKLKMGKYTKKDFDRQFPDDVFSFLDGAPSSALYICCRPKNVLISWLGP
jgi:hypothetical protein